MARPNMLAEGRRKMVRTRQWKYVHDPMGDRDELYDLVRDPGELANVVDETRSADALADLRLRLAVAALVAGLAACGDGAGWDGVLAVSYGERALDRHVERRIRLLTAGVELLAHLGFALD